ncbi:UDP-Glycosyltransferase/glycogen phosphorylase [Pseudohyphozyma bogoriensis]|nr:UDP-Glycosyltransferase/glycogen phosphorylase [Pseudohyphozyma bogoriensis]
MPEAGPPPPGQVFLETFRRAIIIGGLWLLYFVISRAPSYLGRRSNAPKRAALLSSLGIKEAEQKKKKVVGFFHPYCNAGGGGERVLWAAVDCLQKEEKDAVCVIYTGDVGITKDAIVDKVTARFGIKLDSKRLALVELKKRYLVEDGTWKRFTLLGQSLGSVSLAWEALKKGLVPDVYIDTMGYAFTYPLVRWIAGVPIGSYTHYPTISTDMLNRVQSRKAGHTNTSFIANSFVMTHFKLLYYQAFAKLYTMCLRQTDVLMVNSSWTYNHINLLLHPNAPPYPFNGPAATATPEAEPATAEGLRNRKKGAPAAEAAQPAQQETRMKKASEPRIVFPPCDTVALAKLPVEMRERIVLSLAQFRPEKEQDVQLRAFKAFLDENPKFKEGKESVKLILAGSVRDESDEKRVEVLKELAAELKIQVRLSSISLDITIASADVWRVESDADREQDSVEFVVNVPYPTLIKLLGKASVGLHTMIDEHFGITVVEFMAAGLIPLVHASAGPLLDIVIPSTDGKPTGFHAANEEEFTKGLVEVFGMSEKERVEMRKRARVGSKRFSTNNVGSPPATTMSSEETNPTVSPATTNPFQPVLPLPGATKVSVRKPREETDAPAQAAAESASGGTSTSTSPARTRPTIEDVPEDDERGQGELIGVPPGLTAAEAALMDWDSDVPRVPAKRASPFSVGLWNGGRRPVVRVKRDVAEEGNVGGNVASGDGLVVKEEGSGPIVMDKVGEVDSAPATEELTTSVLALTLESKEPSTISSTTSPILDTDVVKLNAAGGPRSPRTPEEIVQATLRDVLAPAQLEPEKMDEGERV